MKFDIFKKSVEKIQVSLKFDKNNRNFYNKTYVHLYLYKFSLEWGMFQTKVVNTITTDIVFNNFFPENCAVYEITWEKYGTARRATGDNLM
jgi:hypothetical protein